MSLTLRVQLPEAQTVKTLRFAETMSVYDACIQIVEKTREGGKDHAMFKPLFEGAETGHWLLMNKSLENHDLRGNDLVQFKKRHQVITVKLIDGSVKKILVDLTKPSREVHRMIGEKLKLKNWEEFCLYRYQDNGVAGDWLKVDEAITIQVPFTTTLGFKKRYYVSDTTVSREDPVELHLSYAQAKHEIISGEQPAEPDEIINFAGMQCQIEFTNYNPAAHKPGFIKLESVFPQSWFEIDKKGVKVLKVTKKGSDPERDLYNAWKRFAGMDENTAKLKYVQLARSLPTYGMTLFACQKISADPVQQALRDKKGQTGATILAGFYKNGYVEFDPAIQKVSKTVDVANVKRWMADNDILTLDFGEANEGSDYYKLRCKEAEKFSEVIGGYIDILLKLRKDTTIYEDDEDAVFGAEEQLAIISGQAQTSQTTGQVASYGSLVSKIQSIGNARQAIQVLINNAFGAVSPAEAQKTSLSPEQLKGQLANHATTLTGLAQKLHDMLNGPGRENNKLAELAKQIAMFVDNMVVNAKQAQGMGIGDYGNANLVSAAKSVTETFAAFLDLAEGDPKQIGYQAQVFNAKQAAEAALAALMASSNGVYADSATQNLLIELSKAAASAMDNLISDARNLPIQDPAKRQKMVDAADTVDNGAKTLLSVVGRVAMTASDPNCQRYIQEAGKTVNQTINFLLAGAQQAGGGFDMDGLSERARAVAEALKHLLTASELPAPQGDKKALEYFEAAQSVLDECSGLMGAAGRPQVINHRMGNVRKNLPILINHTKEKAMKSDDLTKERLHTYAKQVAATSKNLAGICPQAIKEPTNDLWGHKLHDAAARVAEAVAALMGDAGKQMANYAMYSAAKTAAAAAASLVTSAANIEGMLDPSGKSQVQGGRSAANAAVDDLLTSLKSGNEDGVVAAAERFCPAAYGLVTIAKNIIPALPDSDAKKHLIVKCSGAAKAIQQLLHATKNMKAQAGEDAVKEALERLKASEAELDASIMAADAGFLEQKPVDHADAIRKLEGDILEVDKASKELVATARSQPGAIASAMATIADVMDKLVSQIGDVAGSTDKPSEQRAVLNAGKGVVIDINQLLTSAKAMSQSPSDPLNNMMTDAAKAVAQALSRLLGSTASADKEVPLFVAKSEENPLHKEAEEAMSASLEVLKATMAELIQTSNAAPSLIAQAGLSPSAQNISVAILTASTAIARAQSTLVQASKAAHHEIRQMEMHNGIAGDDTFARGLITAAPVIANAVSLLADAAKGTTSGSTSEADIRRATDEVRAATETLIKAFAKNPERQARLAASAKQVTDSIVSLVKAAAEVTRLEKEAAEAKKGYDISAEQLAEIEAQMQILELEKKIRRARAEMGKN